jgi:VanZ family protein
MNWKYLLAVVAYCAFIYQESSGPIPMQADQSIPGIDKVAHALLYGGLAALVSLGMRRSSRAYAPRAQFYLPILFAFLYGISDEIHQYYVPSRNFDPWDVAANTAGAILLQYWLCVRRWGLKI